MHNHHAATCISMQDNTDCIACAAYLTCLKAAAASSTSSSCIAAVPSCRQPSDVPRADAAAWASCRRFSLMAAASLQQQNHQQIFCLSVVNHSAPVRYTNAAAACQAKIWDPHTSQQVAARCSACSA
jgi:hypothetical protein